MVLSGSKKTTYMSSLVNQNSGGGSKKAGLPPTANVSHVSFAVYDMRGKGLLSTVNMRTNRFKRNATQNLPLNMTRGHIGMH